MWFKNGLKAQKPLEAAWPEGQKLIEAARPERARGVHPGHEGSKSLRVIFIFQFLIPVMKVTVMKVIKNSCLYIPPLIFHIFPQSHTIQKNMKVIKQSV